MAIRRLVWAPKARQDLPLGSGVTTLDWRRLRSLTACCTKSTRAVGLSQRPFLGRPRTELMSGLRSILVHPYAVIYRITDDAVEIVRVLHERRDLPTELKKDRD
jgi:hypothetical protein